MTAGEATREFYREQGRKQEQERIIKLLEDKRYLCSTEKACWENLDSGCEYPELIALIKDENRNITSEILPDGTIYIEEINRENKHTHEIDVFGSPCDCGTRHEYCNNCDWVEPCEIERETK
jgi:hypothetical protein